ncbi:substrate-binding domain-containing protein [Roseibium sp. HPY-6]|uniref:substrate-binding domain-containing protein n=1 Tax=Roseibium sp. HPY-6 TaxID=3229852 RepID=UPI00338F3DFD
MSEPAKNEPLFLTTKEVADLLRVKERKVYDLAAADEIPHRRITGKLLFPAQAIRSWINGTEDKLAADRPNVLSGSHDPLLDWAIRASGCGLATLCNGSRDGLAQFQTGTALAAGLHLPEENGWNVDTVSNAGLTNCVLINWATRKRGLLLSADAAASVTAISDLKGRRVALRQPGAGAALLFAKLLNEAGLTHNDLNTSKDYAHTESDAAAAVAAGDVDASLGIEAMAKQFNLSFLPLTNESYDILIDRKSYFSDPVQHLLDFARTSGLREKAESLGGYDLSAIGSVRWVSA